MSLQCSPAPASQRASSSQLGSLTHHPPHLLLFESCFESSHRAQRFHTAWLPSTSQNNGWLTRAVAAGRVCVLQTGTVLLCRQQWGCFNSALRGQGANSRCHFWEIPGNIHSDAHSVLLRVRRIHFHTVF